MSFPDDPKLLNYTHQFASAVLAGDTPDDLRPTVSNLLGFAKNFYLQFFADEYNIEISGFKAEGMSRARRLTRGLAENPTDPKLRLVSHYVNIGEQIGAEDTSDQLDPDELRSEVLAAVSELLMRIQVWASATSLDALALKASQTHGDFEEACLVLA